MYLYKQGALVRIAHAHNNMFLVLSDETNFVAEELLHMFSTQTTPCMEMILWRIQKKKVKDDHLGHDYLSQSK